MIRSIRFSLRLMNNKNIKFAFLRLLKFVHQKEKKKEAFSAFHIFKFQLFWHECFKTEIIIMTGIEVCHSFKDIFLCLVKGKEERQVEI